MTLQVESDTIIHKGSYAKPGAELKIGDTVKLLINKDKRIINARLHSAGHLLDICFQALGHDKASKGYHFPDAPYVEFAGKLDEKAREKAKIDLQNKINEVLKAAKEEDKVDAKVYTYDEAAKILGTMPSYLKPGMEIRIIKINGMDKGCPCGGTHVKNIKELGNMTIEKVKSAGSKSYKIYYALH